MSGCNTVEATKTMTVRVNESLKRTYWLSSFVGDGFRSFMSLAEGRAMSTSCLTSRTLKLCKIFSLISFRSFTPARACES